MAFNIEKRNGGVSKKILIIVLAVLTIASICAAAFFYQKYETLHKNPQAEASQSEKQLVNQVGKLMTLPSGETPTIATVQDITKLKDQPFFKNAKNDDKLLIYTSSKQAIIYRSSTNKIINVGPIAITESTPTSKTTK